MAGNRDLGFPVTSGASLRDQLAIKTFRNVRAQGHIYVDLREDKKRKIFFCTLCLAPCYSDTVLFDHLKGNLHTKRLAAAKLTLMKPNPWPFNDGVYFFCDSTEKVKPEPPTNDDRLRLLDTCLGPGDNSLAIVAHSGSAQPVGSDEGDTLSGLGKEGVDSDADKSSHEQVLDGSGDDYDLVIPGVLHKEEIRELHAKFIGVGLIAARVSEKDGSICKMWCEWLGKKDSGSDDVLMVPEHDFAVVSFAYNYDLGRKGLLNDVRYLLLSQQDTEGPRKKRKKSFSDPEDISESLSNQYDSSGEEAMSSNSSSSKLSSDGYGDQLLHSGLSSSRTLRKEMRKQQHVAAQKMCDICQHKLLPGKDVATLLNTKTGRIVCSSRNVNGAFHVYHISCLVHWILLCESEIHNKQMGAPEVKRTSKRKTGGKKKETEEHDQTPPTKKQIYSVFCPECQGTGINIHGDELEKPIVALSEMFKYKIKMSDARREWMNSPEELQNCSTGFRFQPPSEEATQEKVSPLKLLHFFRADD